MVSLAEPAAENSTISIVAGAFVLFAAVAWFAFPGVSVAVACYGALLVSEHLYCLFRSPQFQHRFLGLLALALTWLIVLAYVTAALPSNLGAAII
jgi:hypothetical protein